MLRKLQKHFYKILKNIDLTIILREISRLIYWLIIVENFIKIETIWRKL